MRDVKSLHYHDKHRMQNLRRYLGLQIPGAFAARVAVPVTCWQQVDCCPCCAARFKERLPQPEEVRREAGSYTQFLVPSYFGDMFIIRGLGRDHSGHTGEGKVKPEPSLPD